MAQPGRWIPRRDGTQSYRAFVPDPLPPHLDYTPPLIHTLSAADRAVGELAGLGRTLSNPWLLIRPLIRREAVLSSRIEGTETGIQELYAYEAGMEVERVDEAKEVLNYVRALEFALEYVQQHPISLNLLRKLHWILMEDVRGARAMRGEFRRLQNWIGSPGSSIEQARYVPPPPGQPLMEALSAWERYLHIEEPQHPPLVRLALIHYAFEAIHPFIDGNGRIGRLLLALLLQTWGLLPQPLLYLSAYFEAHRREYYDLLLAVSKEGAWETWIQFFLRGIQTQAKDTIQRIHRLQDLQSRWRERITEEGRAPAKLMRLVDYLFEKPILQAQEVEQLLGVSNQTAQKYIRRLVKKGILQNTEPERRKNKRYRASAIIEIVLRES